ncbi:abortive infection family protein [Komagataeibacter saccharivorans]|uniref:abortive infection family protein n=1 Tax=Komagataeibacter saccharivorans TaxID=265959 RepID=UPI0039E74A1F
MSADWYPGIRAFCAYWEQAPMLQQTFETLEREFNDENDACIDAAKGLVECACRVLIEELDDPLAPLKPNATDTPLGQLVGLATRLLGLGAVRHRAFSDLIKQHNKLTETLRVLRNEAGTVSHGKDGFITKLSIHHRGSAMLAADAIITFLHEAYLEREPDPVRTFEPYERFESSNAIIDEFASLRAELDDEGSLTVFVVLPEEEVPLAIEPSRLLFGIDREAYKAVLNTCRDAKVAEVQEGEIT